MPIHDKQHVTVHRQQSEIARMDLNLLKVLVALLDEGSVTRAGEALNLAQSTISHSLARLRAEFANPMFVRTSNGMQPTELTLALAPAVKAALVTMQGTLESYRQFEPATSERFFQLLATDAAEYFFVPKLVTRLKQVAPNIRLRVRPLPRHKYHKALESGLADLALGQLPGDDLNLKQQLLFRSQFMLFARKGHPIFGEPTLDRLLESEHLVVGKPAKAEAHVRKALRSKARRRTVAVELGHYLTASRVLAQTDLVAIMPDLMCQMPDCQQALDSCPLPFAIEPIALRQVWHVRTDGDHGCRWLRHEVARLYQGKGT